MVSRKQTYRSSERMRLKMSFTTISAALAAMVPATVYSADVVISTATSSVVTWSTDNLTVTSGGSVTNSATTVNGQGATLGTLVNGGTISSGDIGVFLHGAPGSPTTVGGVTNNLGATIITTGTTGVDVYSTTVGTISNSGLISAVRRGIANETSNITSITNSTGATITLSSDRGQVISNNGSLGTLVNNGALIVTGTTSNTDGAGGAALSPNPMGIANYQSIGGVTNNGSISVSGTSSTGLYNSSAGTIGSIANTGNITVTGAGSAGIDNAAGGSITTVNNSGTITATGSAANGIYNAGTINSLTNGGTINSVGGGRGLYNLATGAITTFVNSGTIIGDTYALRNKGAITTLTNTGRISSAGWALYNSATGSIGTFTNSGVFAGTIVNASSTGLSLIGAAGSTYGTFTGASGGIGSGDIGLIDHQQANLEMSSGNILLNDNINVTGHNLTNTAATLQINNSIRVTGDYNQAQAATLRIGVADGSTSAGTIGDSGYGRLVVSGIATIASGSSVNLHALNGFSFRAGQRFVVMEAATAGTNYNQNTLNYSADGYAGRFTAMNVVNGAQSDFLVCLGISCASQVATSATTPNAISAIAGLYRLPINNTNAGLLSLFNSVAGLGSTAEANRAGAQLRPASPSSGVQAAMAPTFEILNMVTTRADNFRLAQGSGITGLAAGDSPSQWAAWSEIIGGRTTQDQRDNIDGYKGNFSGLILGMDTAVNDDWRAGGVFSWAKTTVTDSGDRSGDSSHLDSYGLLGYASYTGKPWYIDVSAGALQHHFDTYRSINIPGFSGVATGQHKGMQYVARLGVGYPIALGSPDARTTLTPLTSFTYSRLNQDSYVETGGSGAALRVDALSTTSLKSDIGAKIERGYSTAYGELVPEVKAVWRHEYRGGHQNQSASFAADLSGATAFTTENMSPAKDSLALSAGVTIIRNSTLTLSAKYEVEHASGYTSQVGRVRLRWVF